MTKSECLAHKEEKAFASGKYDEINDLWYKEKPCKHKHEKYEEWSYPVPSYMPATNVYATFNYLSGRTWDVQQQLYGYTTTGSITNNITVGGYQSWQGNAWQQWQGNAWQQQSYVSGNITVASAEPTPEQMIEWASAEAVRQKAKGRARELLHSLLTDPQREQLEKDNSFELNVGSRIYRIRTGLRVERLNPATKKIESYFCIHPDLSHNLPAEDVAISQKLYLETNEELFLKIANETKAA